MRFLRSNLLIAIVSLFVLTGYAYDVLDYCCESEKQDQAAQSKTSSGKTVPVKKIECQCLCHQIFTAHTAAPISTIPAVLCAADFVAQPDEFPPDAVPLGIDYPPQLA